MGSTDDPEPTTEAFESLVALLSELSSLEDVNSAIEAAESPTTATRDVDFIKMFDP